MSSTSQSGKWPPAVSLASSMERCRSAEMASATPATPASTTPRVRAPTRHVTWAGAKAKGTAMPEGSHTCSGARLAARRNVVDVDDRDDAR
jgi:hypothetical protein